jgi:hypothetical protein
MCSILWWILYTWEALGCIFSNLSLGSCISNKGEKGRWRKVAVHPWNLFQESRGSLCFSFPFLDFEGVVCCVKSAWPVLETGLNQFWWNQSDRFWEPAWPVCAQSWHLFRGSLHMCRGSSCFLWWFVFFAWAWFCLGCVEPLPLPKGSKTCLLEVILIFAFLGFRSLVWNFFLFVSFLFLFSLFTKCVCCQCTHQGGDWGPCVVRGPVDGRFLVWWVIDNVVWTDS